jgi:hypothetical protein
MPHESRVEGLVTGFTSANDRLIAALEALSDDAASRRPADGGWTPAQIGWHVAITTKLLASVITGEAPMAKPAPEGFAENPAVFAAVPEKVQTFPQLVPPAVVSRAEALTNLRSSADPMVLALRSLTPERAKGFCVPFPFGTLSLYQMGEFAGAHVLRHHAQLQRDAAGV